VVDTCVGGLPVSNPFFLRHHLFQLIAESVCFSAKPLGASLEADR
jgi:hypothetical protein